MRYFNPTGMKKVFQNNQILGRFAGFLGIFMIPILIPFHGIYHSSVEAFPEWVDCFLCAFFPWKKI
jgi:hypothetical protein